MSNRTIVCQLALSFVLLGAGFSVQADGTDDPVAARKSCQAKGADTPEKLKSCCADEILTDPLSKQRRLEMECATGVEQPKSAGEIAADEKRKAAAAQSGAAPATPAAASNPPTSTPTASAPAASAADSKPSLTDALNKCNGSQAHQALSSLGNLARRLGAKVPNTDCP